MNKVDKKQRMISTNNLGTHIKHAYTHIHHIKKDGKRKNKSAEQGEHPVSLHKPAEQGELPMSLHTTPYTRARVQATWIYASDPMLSHSLMLTPTLFQTDSLNNTLMNTHSSTHTDECTDSRFHTLVIYTTAHTMH